MQNIKLLAHEMDSLFQDQVVEVLAVDPNNSRHDGQIAVDREDHLKVLTCL